MRLTCFATLSLAVLAGGLVSACSMPNPEFEGLGDDTGETGRPGDGDGDPTTTTSGSSTTSTTTGDGDGDGDPSTGDGDGEAETSTSGDGDGDNNTGDGDGDSIQCAEGKELCGDACVDLERDNLNCGACGVPCEGATICGLGECLPKRYVFVSSQPLAANFGGAETADGHCQELAGVAQLPGDYRAWVSDEQQSPAEVFTQPEAAAYLLKNGAIVAYSWDDLVDGELEAQINRDEFGQAIAPSPVQLCNLDHGVWTGTSNAGDAADPWCFGWSTVSAEVFGVVGNATSLTDWSQIDCTAPCNLQLPVYCVQQ